MRRNKHNLAIVRMLISIAVLTPVCSMVESSSLPAQALATQNTASTSDQPDATTALLSQTTTDEQRVSVSLNDELNHSIELLKKLPPAARTSGGPDIDVWYGEYFKAHNLRVLSASPIEKEPSRLGLKISFTF